MLVRSEGLPHFNFQGYIKAGCPQAALAVQDEILRLGLTPDRLTYNTLILACVKNENVNAAMHFFKEMKVTSFCMQEIRMVYKNLRWLT